MKKLLPLILLLTTLLTKSTLAYTYGGPGNDYGAFITKTFDGGYLLAGESFTTERMIYLVKLSPTLSLQWTKYIGNPSLPNTVSYVSQDIDSGYVLMGTYDDDYGNGTPSAWMIKTNSTGDSLYSRQYNNSMWANWGEYCHVLPDGSYILGMIGDDATASNPMDIFRIDTAGTELWRNTVNGSSYFFAYPSEYLFTRDSSIVVASTNSVGPWYTIVSKVDLNGNTLFYKSFEDNNNFTDIRSFGICERPDSGYMIVGDGNYFTGISQAFSMQLNSQGDSVQTFLYDTSVVGDLKGIKELSDGNFIVGGNIATSGQNDVKIMKINSTGDTLWTRTYGGPGDDFFVYLDTNYDGGFLIVGDSSAGANNSDIWLIYTDSLGNINYTVSINNILNTENAVVYPNPSANYIKMEFSNSDRRTISLFSSEGKLVRKTNTEDSSVMLDVATLPSGIYTLFAKGRTTQHYKVAISH